jgi:hypothetical protein
LVAFSNRFEYEFNGGVPGMFASIRIQFVFGSTSSSMAYSRPTSLGQVKLKPMTSKNFCVKVSPQKIVAGGHSTVRMWRLKFVEYMKSVSVMAGGAVVVVELRILCFLAECSTHGRLCFLTRTPIKSHIVFPFPMPCVLACVLHIAFGCPKFHPVAFKRRIQKK